MTLEKTKTSQRKNRYTLYLDDSENSQIRETALDQGYSNKAIGRYIREQVLSSLSDAEKAPSIVIPSVNSKAAKDLNGAVTNLNQSLKSLNTIALSSPVSAQKVEAEKMMTFVIKIAQLCKDYKNIFEGSVKNKRLLASLIADVFSSDDIHYIADVKAKREAKS